MLLHGHHGPVALEIVVTRKKPPTGRQARTHVKTAGKRATSSTRWLDRQLNDPYVHRAQRLGYRSRAAFKLLEIDEKAALFQRGGLRVVDLGAAPGGWSQVAVEKKAGPVVAIDLLAFDPIPGVEILQMDFMAEEAPDKLKALLGGQADLVLSDMSPNTSGHRQTDHLRIMMLAEAACDFAIQVLAPGGAFIAKVFQGGTGQDLLTLLKSRFESVKHIKPPASRKESPETYVVATGFKP